MASARWPARADLRPNVWTVAHTFIVAACLTVFVWLQGDTFYQALTLGAGAIVVGSVAGALSRRRATRLPEWLTRAQRAEVLAALRSGRSPQDHVLAQALLDHVNARSGRTGEHPTGPARRGRASVFAFFAFAVAVCVMSVGFGVVAAIDDLGDGNVRQGLGDVLGALALFAIFILSPLVAYRQGRTRSRAAESARGVLSRG